MDRKRRAEFVSNWIGLGSVGAEIGVWRGDFAQVLLEISLVRHLYLVDPWEFRRDLPNAWYGGGKIADQKGMDDLVEEVKFRFAKEVDTGRVSIVREKSRDAVLPEALDWVYIDGDHTFEAVLDDITVWRSRVRNGGTLFLDDYGLEGWWENGVTRAVSEATAAGVVELVEVFESQAVLRIMD